MKKSKKTFKRVLAVALAALMVGSSLPLASFAATQEDITALDTAITAYQTKMDGKVYKNMKPAYDSYIKALKVRDAFNYGGKIDVEATKAAQELTQNTNNMTEWDSTTPIKSVTPSFRDDANEDLKNYKEGETHAGLIYAPKCTASCGMIEHNAMGDANTEFKICYPTYVVVYDGVHTPKMPVMSIGRNHANAGKFCYGVFPVKSANDYTDNADIQLESYWRGDKGTTGESNKDVPNKMNFAYNYVNGKHSADSTFHEKNGSGYNNATGLQGHHNAANKGVEYVRYSWSMFQYTYYERYQANVMLFKGKLAADEYSRTIPSTTWYTAIGGDPDSPGVTGKTVAKTFVANEQPIYVINIETLNKAVKNAADTVNLANAKDITVDSANFSTLLGAIDNATNFDVTAGDYQTDTQKAVNDKAYEIKALKEAIDGSTANIAVDGERTGYQSLRQAMDESKAIFEAGNDDNQYTSSSFQAFSNAYTAAQKAMETLDSPYNSTGYANEAEARELADNLNLMRGQLQSIPKHEHTWGEWEQADDGLNHIKRCTYPNCEEVQKELCSTKQSTPEYKAPTENEVGYRGRTYCTVCKRIVEQGEQLDATAYFSALKSVKAIAENPDYTKKHTPASIEKFEKAVKDALLDLNNDSTTKAAIDKSTAAIMEAITALTTSPTTFSVKLMYVVTDAEGNVTETATDPQVVNYGSVFTADATEHVGDNYIANWEIVDDSTNGTTKINTTENTVQFTVTSNSTVKVYITEKPVDAKNYTKVTLYNQNGSVNSIHYVEDVNSLDLNNLVINGKKIEAPAVPFYTFNTWVVKSSSTGEYNLKAEYTFVDSSDSYSQIIGVNGAKINGVAQLTAKYDSLINLSGGEAYAIVADGNAKNVITYLNSTTAIHVPHNERVYIAVVDKADLNTATSGVVGKLVKDKSANYGEGMKSASYNCVFNLPEGSTLVECGALGTDKAEIATDLDKFQINNEENLNRFKADTHSRFNEYTISFISKFTSGTVFYGRSYIIYKDALGDQHIVYGNVEQITL